MKKLLLALALAALLPTAHAQLIGNPPDVQAKINETIAKAQDPSELIALANVARQRNDFKTIIGAMEKLVSMRPQSGDFGFGLATAYALDGQKSATYNALLRLQKQGLSYDVDNNPDFKLVADTEVFRYIADALKLNGKTFGGGKPALTLKSADVLSEALAYDATRSQVLLGDVAQGVVWQIAANGSKTALISATPENGVAGVLGVAVDAMRGKLWVASAQLPQFQRFDAAHAGESSLARFNLKTGAFETRLTVPKEAGARVMSHLAVAPDGTLYIADGMNPAVYVVRPGANEIEPLLSNPALSDLRAIALSPDGRKLYLADISMGLYAVDLSAKTGAMVVGGESLNMGGITGLAVAPNGALLIVQGGTSPKRVMRLKLKSDGVTVDGIEPLDAAQPALKAPVGAALAGERLLTIANSQWSKYGLDGKLLPNQTLEPITLWQSDLQFAGVSPSADDMMKEMQRATQARQQAEKKS
jgi:sugar lactone lactonase YvrE